MGNDPERRTRAIRKAPTSGEVVNRSCCGGGCHEGDDERDEGPSEADIQRFGDVTQKCPQCGTELHDDAAVCWSCGHALAARSERRMSPVAIVVVVLLVIALVGFFVLR
jgi:predicted nucleic acid-binding Zn ribbon protein